MADQVEIPSLLIDDQDDATLLSRAMQRTQAASNNLITDWSLGSPTRAIIEGQVFCIEELKYFMSLLPRAIAIEVYKIYGIQRNLGTAATGSLTFQLAYPIQSNFVINIGYSVAFNTGYFITTQQLVIPAGSTTGSVTVTADHVGSDMNTPAYTVVNSSPGLAYLQSIYNEQAIGGGTDLEDLDVTISRGQDVIRNHNVLVSVADYENAAVDLLGGGVATCIPLLSSDKTTYKAGQVHLFIADALGNAPSSGTCQSIQSQLQLKSFVASSVWVDPVDLYPVTLLVVANCLQLSSTLADAIYQSILDFLSPLNYTLGATLLISELSYYVRSTTGVTSVGAITINGNPFNQPLPHIYSTPFLDTLQLSLIQPDSVSQNYIRGLGEGAIE